MNDFYFIVGILLQLKRTSTLDFQNDIMPGYHYQFDDDDYHFQPRAITILPAKGE